MSNSNGALLGWASLQQAIKARTDAPGFRDPHVAKVLRAMGGLATLLYLNDRDTPPVAVKATRREFLDLYDSISKNQIPAEVKA
jgi:hypothetical protein